MYNKNYHLLGDKLIAPKITRYTYILKLILLTQYIRDNMVLHTTYV